MPWTAESGKSYKLCLLDTNILSEMVKNPDKEGAGFIKIFGPFDHAPCFTVYNLFELRRKPNLFKKFVSLFRVYACFLLKPQPMILEEERKANGLLSSVSPLLHAFSLCGSNPSYDFQHFINEMFSMKDFLELEQNWRKEECETLEAWLKQKENFKPNRPTPNATDADEYLKEAGMQSLIASDLEWAGKEIKAGRTPDVNHFPSLKVFLYSLYYRLYDPSWKAKPQEVTDLMIASVAPYMDVVVTEAFQAEIFKKVRKKVYGLDNLRIASLRDIRL